MGEARMGKGVYAMIQQKKLFVAVLSILFSLSPAAHGAAVFQTAQSYSVGTNPGAVAVGDFNGDGTPDLAVCNFGDPTAGDDGTVSLLLGKGDGTFQAATNFPAVKNCTKLAAGDFDSNGSSDLVVVREGDATVSDNGGATIFLSNGDGTFRKGQTLIPGKNPADVAVTDLDADHKLDLTFANRTDDTVSVLLGNGDGSVQSPVVYSVGLRPHSVKVVDVNRDGKSDVAVFRIAGADFLLGNGDGSFRQGSSVSVGSFTDSAIAIADFNKDGALDLVARGCNFLHPNQCGTSIMLGNGSGGFQSSTLISDIPGATAADANGDGKLDLAGQTPDGSQLAVLLGNGDGTFQAPLTFSAGTTPAIGALVDVDGDKAPDLIATNATSNSTSVLLNTGTDFSISASAPSPSSVGPGQSATSTLSLTLLNAFDNPVSLACSVQPAQAGSPACSLSSSSVTFDSSGKATATVTITAGAGAAALMVPRPYHADSRPFSLGWLPVAAFGLMGTGLGCGYSRKRRHLFFVGCVLAGLIFQAACGGSSPKSVNYAITVTGTSGSTQHSTSTTLTVQ
jgi:FG-GAP-like repeat